MIRFLPRHSRVIAAIAIFSFSPLTSLAQQEASMWQCLPDDVVAALRISNGQAVLEAMKATKFGQVMLTEDRKAALLEVCEEHSDDGWMEVKSVMEEYELSMDDLLGLFAGETGYAVALTREGDEASVPFGLGWLQPGEELAVKVYAAIGKAIEDQDGDVEETVTRVDLDLAGQDVMQLRFPSMITTYTEEFQMPEGYDDLPEDEQDDAFHEAYDKYESSAVVMPGHQSVLVCQLGGRLLVAHQFSATAEADAEAADEQLSDLLANVISAHASGGAEGFVSRMTDDSSVQRTFSADGQPIMELLADLQGIITTLSADVENKDQFEKWARMFALDRFGPFALRQTADGATWRTHVGMALPAPRKGLMRLLDQELLEIDPPQWVPASAVRYFQISFNLGEAYETIKEEVTSEFAEQTSAGFEMAEMQVQNFAQVSLPELLSSLGNQHTVMSFGVQTVELEGATDADLENNLSDRMAFVWQVTDEQVWSKLLKVIAPFAGMAPGTTAAEEQGFSGYRMKSDQMEGGLFLGKGYLVLGIGDGVVEKTLSALNNPPSGSNALRGSEVFSNASAALELQPAMLAEITDNDRYLRSMFDKMNQQFDQVEAMMSAMTLKENDSDQGMFFFDVVRVLMPKGEEFEDLMGVSVSRTEINDDGMFLESVQEMPLP